MHKYTDIPNYRFTSDELLTVQKLKAQYPEGQQKSAILPLLHMVQEKHNGWLSVEAMDYTASLLDITPIEVYEVVTFYSMYNQKPVGKFVLEFCRTSPCCLVGAEKIQNYTEKKLGIKEGETTTDGMFTIKTMECLGACGYGPMMQVGDLYFENLTPEKMDQLIADFKAGNINVIFDPETGNPAYTRLP